MGMCVPDIYGVAPDYGIKAAHYVAAILSEMVVEGYFYRVIDSDAIMETTQYKYDLKTHTINTLEGNLPEYYSDNMGVEGFEAMDNPLLKLQFNAETEDFSTLGPNVSKKV